MAKKAAVKKDGSATPAVTEKAVGRAPKVKGTPLSIFEQTLALVSIASGERKEELKKLWLDRNPEVKAKTKVASSAIEEPAEEEVEVEQAPVQAEGPAEFLHYRVEKLEEIRKLTSDERVAFEKLVSEVKAAKGIHGKRIVPCTAVYMCAHTKVHFLDPAGDEDSQKFYNLLYHSLYSQGRSLIGEYISGNTRSAISIIAEEFGLVMWQLPRPTKIKNIREAITQEWRQATPNRHEREAFDALSSKLYAPQLNEADIEDPLQAYLSDVWQQKKRRRHKLLDSTSHGRRSLTEALKIALEAKPDEEEVSTGGPNKPR